MEVVSSLADIGVSSPQWQLLIERNRSLYARAQKLHANNPVGLVRLPWGVKNCSKLIEIKFEPVENHGQRAIFTKYVGTDQEIDQLADPQTPDFSSPIPVCSRTSYAVSESVNEPDELEGLSETGWALSDKMRRFLVNFRLNNFAYTLQETEQA